jgi:hypothetical protein
MTQTIELAPVPAQRWDAGASERTHAGLVLTIGANKWTSVELIHASGRNRMGSDVLDVVLFKLKRALADELAGKPIGAMFGVAVHAMMTLGEDHHTVYAGQVGTFRHLYIQNAEAKLVATLELAPEDRATWLGALAAATSA